MIFDIVVAGVILYLVLVPCKGQPRPAPDSKDGMAKRLTRLL